jgi:hypothetical protein
VRSLPCPFLGFRVDIGEGGKTLPDHGEAVGDVAINLFQDREEPSHFMVVIQHQPSDVHGPGVSPKRLVGFVTVFLEPADSFAITVRPAASHPSFAVWDSCTRSVETVTGDDTVHVGTSADNTPHRTPRDHQRVRTCPDRTPETGA